MLRYFLPVYVLFSTTFLTIIYQPMNLEKELILSFFLFLGVAAAVVGEGSERLKIFPTLSNKKGKASRSSI